MTERRVVKRTARAILLTNAAPRPSHGGSTPELVLIKRTKPGRPPYWITPGGGVEPGRDATVVDALHREVDEELGATVTDVVPAFVDTVRYGAEERAADQWEAAAHRTGVAVAAGPGTPEHANVGEDVKVQHFFVCRLASMDPSRRHGPEVEAPRGAYEVVRVPFTRPGIASVEVVPPTLRAYLDANIEGVLALLEPDFG